MDGSFTTDQEIKECRPTQTENKENDKQKQDTPPEEQEI